MAGLVSCHGYRWVSFRVINYIFSTKYGAIVERYMSTCHQPPVLLIFDFSADAIYHCSQCGDKLSANEIEKFVSQFNDKKLTPTGKYIVTTISFIMKVIV